MKTVKLVRTKLKIKILPNSNSKEDPKLRLRIIPGLRDSTSARLAKLAPKQSLNALTPPLELSPAHFQTDDALTPLERGREIVALLAAGVTRLVERKAKRTKSRLELLSSGRYSK